MCGGLLVASHTVPVLAQSLGETPDSADTATILPTGAGCPAADPATRLAASREEPASGGLSFGVAQASGGTIGTRSPCPPHRTDTREPASLVQAPGKATPATALPGVSVPRYGTPLHQ
jgi:hypothetical protein